MTQTADQLPTLDKRGSGSRQDPLLPLVFSCGAVYCRTPFPNKGRSRARLVPAPALAARPHPRCRSAARLRRPAGPAGTERTRRRSRGGQAPATSAPIRLAPRSSRPLPTVLATRRWSYSKSEVDSSKEVRDPGRRGGSKDSQCPEYWVPIGLQMEGYWRQQIHFCFGQNKWVPRVIN